MLTSRVVLLKVVLLLFLKVYGSTGLDPQNAWNVSDVGPDDYVAVFETTKGEVHIQVHRTWAPNASDRFYYLVQSGYFNNNPFFRVLFDWVVQFGISGSPELNALYTSPETWFETDDVIMSNTKGFVSFGAEYDDNEQAVHESAEIFINYQNNSRLDAHGFAPFGQVIVGFDNVLMQLHSYGELLEICEQGGSLRNMSTSSSSTADCTGPSSERLYNEGNAYTEVNFPEMDYIVRTSLLTSDIHQVNGYDILVYISVGVGVTITVILVLAKLMYDTSKHLPFTTFLQDEDDDDIRDAEMAVLTHDLDDGL